MNASATGNASRAGIWKDRLSGAGAAAVLAAATAGFLRGIRVVTQAGAPFGSPVLLLSMAEISFYATHKRCSGQLSAQRSRRDVVQPKRAHVLLRLDRVEPRL